MITPWSTNAVEITQNMGIEGIVRIEEYFAKAVVNVIDPMLVVEFNGLDQSLFTVDIAPEKVIQIQDIAAYNKQEGLALNQEEIDYLNELAVSLGRPSLPTLKYLVFLKSILSIAVIKSLMEPLLLTGKQKKVVFFNSSKNIKREP